MASTSQSKVYFFFDAVHITLQNRTQLKKFIQALFKKEGQELESLNYIFSSDKALLRINNDYLQHDYYTDIITFELAANGLPTVGEIYISVDRVRDNAKQLNVSFKKELHRVIFHGALHLVGFGDKTPKDKRIMNAKEDQYLANYFK